MKRYIFIISALFAVGTAAAQDDISKHLEVTKAYTPKVGQAAKLAVEPRMVDTVQLRPRIEYSITPTAWRTAFSSDKYSPAIMSVVPFEKNRPLYVRLGAGYPLQSTADLYFNPYVGNNSTFGMFFNHRGSFSKIENELGVKPKSAEMLNTFGLYGSRSYSRYKLEGSLGYDNRMYSPYGVIPYQVPGTDPSNVASSFTGNNSFNLGRIGGNISFGDTFTDLSRLNFNIGLDMGAAHLRSDFYQMDIDAHAMIAKMFTAVHGFEMGLYERGTINLDGSYPGNSTSFSLCPAYLLALNKFKLKAGVDLHYIHDELATENHFVAAPKLEALADIAKGYFTPYLTLGSELLDGSYEALSRRNPYNDPNSLFSSLTGWTYDLRLGFSGNVNSIFSYRVYGGISWLKSFTAFMGYQEVSQTASGATQELTYSPLWFRPLTDDGTMSVFGAELGLHNLGGFSMKAGVEWNSYDFKNFPIAMGLPKYEADLGLAYAHKKFKVSAGAKFMGPRDFMNMTIVSSSSGSETSVADTDRCPASVDVSAAFEYNISNNFGVFIEGRNLANQKLYPYDYYRGLGANVMLGIKAVF